MTKAELIAQVAKNAGTTPKDVEVVLNGFRDVVQASVKTGKDISYPGLGKFSRVSRKARMARNPRTGEALKVAATKVPRFVASEGFKRVVRGETPAPKLAR
ncbi:MAG: HU family DNA-binding protein [Dehalococcoidia bacterium]